MCSLIGILLAVVMTKFIMSSILLGSGEETKLKDALNASFIYSTDFHPPTSKEVAIADSLFANILKKRSYSNIDVLKFSNIRLHLYTISERRNDFAVISEPTPSNGDGFYAIKLTGSPRNIVLLAPHIAHDLLTGDIIYKMFLSENFLAAGWSTTHRKVIDLCKEPASFFNAFTQAAATIQSPIILQLHGFNKHSRQPSSDLIVSSTKVNPEQFPIGFLETVSCLKQNLDSWKVKSYPADVKFLGGTLNINAAKFYERNPNGAFYHVETSKELRIELLHNDTLRNKFQNCFL